VSAIVEIKPGDVSPVVEYLASFAGENRSRRFWEARTFHWWKGNPFYSEDLPMGWVLIEGSKIVGFKGLIALPYKTGERTGVGFGATVWRIDKEHRGGAGLSFMAKTMELCSSYMVFNTTPTEGVKKILRYYGFSEIPASDRRYATFIAYPGANMLRLSNSRFWRAGYRSLSVLSSYVHRRAKDFRVWGQFKTVKPHLSIREAFATGEFERLWRHTRERFELTRIRDARYLQWYCFGNDEFRHKELFLSQRDNRVDGFGIFMPRRVSGAQDLLGIDIWPPDDLEVLRSVTVQALLFAMKKPFDTITVPCPAAAAGKLFGELGAIQLLCETAAPHHGSLCGPPWLQRIIDSGGFWFSKAEGDYGC
jgi:hypothetical protein